MRGSNTGPAATVEKGGFGCYLLARDDGMILVTQKLLSDHVAAPFLPSQPDQAHGCGAVEKGLHAESDRRVLGTSH